MLRLAGRALSAKGYELVPTALLRPHLEQALRHGDPPGAARWPLLDALPDEELQRLNHLLPWAAFVVDARGRRFGRPWSATKRSAPQPVPDERILAWDQRFPLRGRRVLEVGCFEGLHTAALCQLGAEVTAVDARIENVVKTLTRGALLDQWPRVYCWDLEDGPPQGLELGWDFVHHVGVLYHLEDPLSHLGALASWTRAGVFLDTHVAPEGARLQELRCGGLRARAWTYPEEGRLSHFAGTRPTARWLVQEDLLACLAALGFAVEVQSRVEERHGPRVQLYAWRR